MAITFPASPVNGQTHTENGQIFVFDSTRGYWLLKKQDQIVASTSRSTFVATAGQTVHNVSYDPSASVIVSVNGVMLNPQDVTATNGTSITFDTALTLSDEVDIVFHQPTASNLIRQDISDPMATESYVQTYVTNNSSAGATTAYANFAAFPTTGNTVGDFAFAQDTKALYVWDGTEWDRIDSGDESPIILTEPPTTHTLNNDGTTSTLTMVAEDPEGFDITYGIVYKTTGNTRPAQLSVDTTADANGVYTFTPSATVSDGGTFRARLSASDGAKTTTRFVDFSLGFQADISYLMVAGGGGGASHYAGAGGAGGLLAGTVTLEAQTAYNIVIGAGGAGGAMGTGGGSFGSNGGDTTFNGLTAIGGGGGAPRFPSNAGSAGSGGSGGGGGNEGIPTTGGSGTSGQGYNGGNGHDSGATSAGGGGGGATGAGGNAGSNSGGTKGAGYNSNITGTTTLYAEGGGGASGGTSGLGGGTSSSINGSANTGGGGGGGAGGITGGTGADGVVIIRTINTATSTTGSPTITTDGSYNIYSFTADGSITF